MRGRPGVLDNGCMRYPLLRMGLVGFAQHEREQLARLLEGRTASGVRWTPWPHLESDALWVQGAHAQRHRDGLLRIPSADPNTRAIRLNLQDVDRPLAFTTPATAEVQGQTTFDPLQAASVAGVLSLFEAWLQPLAVQLALSECITLRRRELVAPVYQLELKGRRVAIVCLAGPIGFARTARPLDVMQADWNAAPAGAGTVPPDFVATDMFSLMWQHVMRTGDDFLPRRYRAGLIHFRCPPRVEPRLVRDAHLLVLRELLAQPLSFEQLQAQTGFSEAALAQTLSALYFCRSITTDARRAAPLKHAGRSDPSALSVGASSLLDSRERSGFDLPLAQERTAPAPLKPGR
jgi:hypothetical protein